MRCAQRVQSARGSLADLLRERCHAENGGRLPEQPTVIQVDFILFFPIPVYRNAQCIDVRETSRGMRSR